MEKRHINDGTTVATDSGGNGILAERLQRWAFEQIQTAPHSCSDPQCPGDINRRKLEAAEEMGPTLKDSTAMLALIIVYDSLPLKQQEIIQQRIGLNQAALSSWEKAGKGNL